MRVEVEDMDVVAGARARVHATVHDEERPVRGRGLDRDVDGYMLVVKRRDRYATRHY
jgi:hypothetical protein